MAKTGVKPTNRDIYESLNDLEVQIKREYPNLQSPHFVKINFYSAQWKIIGNLYYYQTPDKRVLAIHRNDFFMYDGSDLKKELLELQAGAFPCQKE